MEIIKHRFNCTFDWGLFSDGSKDSKAHTVGSRSAPDLFKKIPGGIFELRETQPNPET